jgi:hypothetical protein
MLSFKKTNEVKLGLFQCPSTLLSRTNLITQEMVWEAVVWIWEAVVWAWEAEINSVVADSEVADSVVVARLEEAVLVVLAVLVVVDSAVDSAAAVSSEDVEKR